MAAKVQEPYHHSKSRRSRSPVRERKHSSPHPQPVDSPSRSRSRSASPRDEEDKGGPMASRVLGCFGLAQTTSKETLQEVFSKFGPVEQAFLIMDRRTARSRGFGFIYFQHLEDAKKARKELSGTEVEGRRVRVDFSLTQKPHSPTPGRYFHRGGGGY